MIVGELKDKQGTCECGKNRFVLDTPEDSPMSTKDLFFALKEVDVLNAFISLGHMILFAFRPGHVFVDQQTKILKAKMTIVNLMTTIYIRQMTTKGVNF